MVGYGLSVRAGSVLPAGLFVIYVAHSEARWFSVSAVPLIAFYAVIAALVLSPEGLGGISASLQNQLQRSINTLFGSVLATIGLTIPAVLMIGLLTKRPVALGLQGGNLPLLLLTLAVSVVTFASRKTNVLQGCVHLLLFAVFVLLIFAP